MQLRLVPLALALTLAGVLNTAAIADPEYSATAELLRSARMWAAKDRPDLAQTMLEKALAIEATPEVLLQLGSLALRSGNALQANDYLSRLERLFPQHPNTLALRRLYRVNTTGKQALAKARLMARAGNNEGAAEIMRTLFPDGSPPGDIGLEYYQIVGSTRKGQRSAMAGLAKRYRETGEARYRLAWLKLQSNQGSWQENLQAYEALASTADVNRQKLQDDWWTAIKRIPNVPASLRWVNRYLKEFPGDQKAVDYLADLQQQREEALRIARDPAVRARQSGLALLEQGRLDDAWRELQKSLSKRPNDPEVLGGIGLLRLRQGSQDEALTWFQRTADIEPGSRKWRSLIRTASFWAKMKWADALLDRGKLADAQQIARQALEIEPDNADGLALLGNILARGHDQKEAESLYREALRQDEGNASALRGLLALLARGGRGDEAQGLIAEFRRKNPKEIARFNETQAGLLRDEARSYLAAHRPSHALLALENAILLAPRDAWIRHDLANLYESLGLPILSRRVMAEGAKLAPDDPGMNYAYALVLTAQNLEEEALQRLARIPQSARSSAMNELETRAWIKLHIRQSGQLLAAGKPEEAAQMLRQAEHRAAGQPNAIEQVAEGWFGLGQPARGLALMKQGLIDPNAATADSRLYYASLLNRARQDDTLLAFLPELYRCADWNDAQRNTLLAIETDLAARQIEQLLKHGEEVQAHILATRMPVSGKAGELATLKAQARLLMEANGTKAALPILLAILEKHPDDTETLLNLAQLYEQEGNREAAENVIEQMLPRMQENDVDSYLSVARLEVRLGKMAQARQLVARLLTRNPDNPDVLIQAGRIERSDRQYYAALAYFRQALEGRAASPGTGDNSLPLLEPHPSAPSGLALQLAYQLVSPEKRQQGSKANIPTAESGSPALILADGLVNAPAEPPLAPSLPEPIKAAFSLRPGRAEAEIASIEARRDPRMEMGYEKQDKHSADGTSSYHGKEIPFVGWWPIGYDGHGFVHVDQVSIDAGELPNGEDAYLLGKLGAKKFIPSPPIKQSAEGTSVALGYEGDDLRWDIGVVGLGFPVQNLVGGIRKSWEAGKLDYALEFSRRPQTSSLLSYAGTHDPATGEIWGGVTKTSVNGRVATTFDQLYTFASAEYGVLRGKNVLDNNRLALRVGADKDVLRREDMRLNLGLKLAFWRYKENEAYYTFGHGGYYSPQTYTSLSLPVEWSGRNGKLSYLARASVSRSRTWEKDMNYYPTDTALQDEAATGHSVYSGGSGGGFGHALRLAAEYQVTPHLAVGGRYDEERSDYYAPNSILVYLRYLFQPHLEPVRFPPTAVKPYSHF